MIIYRIMSTIIYRRVVQRIIYRSMSTNIYRRVVHKQTNIYVLKMIYHTWKVSCVRELVRTRGMRWGM